MLAVITGATKGLGRAIAEILAHEGYDLVVCSRSQSDLDQMQQNFATRFPEINVYTLPTDMSNPKAVHTFGLFALNFGTPEVLVNNAGLFVMGGVLDTPEGVLEQQIETNLYSAYHLTRAIVPFMIAAGRGHVFNMCSVASLLAYPNGSAYSISKFALLGFNKSLRRELMDKNIKVTAILPGAAWSDAWAGVTLPRERLMEPTDIAIMLSACLHLSPSAVPEEIILRPQLGDL